MKKQLSYIVVIVFVITSFSCSKEDSEEVQEPVKSSANQVIGFVFKASENTAIAQDVTAIINETNKTISATVAYGTDIKSLTPAIVVSDKAVAGQSGAKDFSSPVNYTVTAEDGTSATYKVTVGIAVNSAKQILSFAFVKEDNELYGDENITATIDEANKTITATISYSANAALLTPSIEVSPNASFNPDTAQDFSNPVAYTITAEDGTTATYQVLLEITFTDRDALIAIYNANPDNTLNWDLEDPNITNWSGVRLDSDGNVEGLNLINRVIEILPPEIGRLPNLQTLTLFGNKLESVPAAIGELSSLTKLQLTSNKLTFLPEEIGKLSNLHDLELDGNELTTLPASIGELSKLDNIYLMSNKLTSLPPEIGNLTNLTTAYINDNKLTSLPKEIGGLKNLTGLEIKDNEFRSFPVELIQLESLTYLNLSNNLITSIPKEISDMISLTGFYLTLNQLTSVPTEIGDITSLTYLYLNENKLTSIPKELGKLTTLTRLYLTNNLLTSIPQEVCKLEDTGTSILLDPGVKCE